MTWNLFIDDERTPDDVAWAPPEIQEMYRNEEWVIARNVDEVHTEIIQHGCLPSFISFDHDLGNEHFSGYKIAQALVADALDFPDEPHMQFPENFDFYVHSQNPIGKANIEGLLNNYLEHRNG